MGAAFGLTACIGEALLAYVLADALTGLYHAATDRGWNIGWQVALFEQHHADPAGMVLDFWAAVLGVPLAAIAVFGWHPAFFIAFGLAISLCQVPHYWAHHRGPSWARVLQRWHMILPPREHAVHHRGFDRNYCTLSGWNNAWLNRVLA
jgi:MFS family permease